MSELAVPKRRVEVAVVLAGGERRRVTVFLAEATPGYAGPERLSDLLEGTTHFVPALDADSGEVLFLNTAAVTSAEATLGAGEDEREAGASATEHAVQVSLVDGRTLHGVVRYALPPERSRLGDFLNDGTRFLAVNLGARVALVNKRDVTRVAVTEG